MNFLGWCFMLTVWGFVSGLFFYSFYRILFDERVYKKKKAARERENT